MFLYFEGNAPSFERVCSVAVMMVSSRTRFCRTGVRSPSRVSRLTYPNRLTDKKRLLGTREVSTVSYGLPDRQHSSSKRSLYSYFVGGGYKVDASCLLIIYKRLIFLAAG
jgi:hypothetical protein